METTEKVKELENALETANKELKEKTYLLDEARHDKEFWYERYAHLNRKHRGLAIALKGVFELADDGNILVTGI